MKLLFFFCTLEQSSVEAWWAVVTQVHGEELPADIQGKQRSVISKILMAELLKKIKKLYLTQMANVSLDE